MRLSIYDQFVVGVVQPSGGWSKGRPIAYLEEEDKCVPLFDLLIPNGLDEDGIARYVSEKFGAFAALGKQVAPLKGKPTRAVEGQDRTVGRRGVAHPHTFAGVR